MNTVMRLTLFRETVAEVKNVTLCFINTNSSDSRFATVMSQSVGGGEVTEFPRPSARRPGMPQRGNYRAEPPRRHCTVQQTTYAAISLWH